MAGKLLFFDLQSPFLNVFFYVTIVKPDLKFSQTESEFFIGILIFQGMVYSCRSLSKNLMFIG